MADPNKPLEDLRKAHEQEYYERRNRELVAKMRDKLAAAEGVEALKAGTGVTDEAILQRLAKAGITPETVPVLHLMPLVQVAWADGTIETGERELLLKAAEERGVASGSAAHTLLEAMLTTRPSQEIFDAALDFIGVLLEALPESDADDARQNLQHLSMRVARAAGGLFGRFFNVADEEKSALAEISRRLDSKSGK